MARSTKTWLLFGLLIFVEYCIFRSYILRDIVPYYPVAYDQTSYLSISYQLYENIISHGLIKGLAQFNLMSQTFFFTIQSALFFLAFGASRLSALTLNFIYFVLLQIISFQTIKNITGKYVFSFILIGMFLAIRLLFAKGGGAIDFRIDFMAFCLYGIFCASVLNSNIFLNKKWTLISAGIAFFLIGMRFIAVCYVLALFFSVFFYYLLQLFLQKKYNYRQSHTKQRIKNLGLFIGILFIIAIPLLWIHHDTLISYYVGGHIKGPEKLMRLKEAGIHSTLANYLYYPAVFFKRQLSIQLAIEILFAFLVLLFAYLKVRLSSTKTDSLKNTASSFNQDNIIFLGLAILLPLIILTMDTSKSSIVGGIVLAPFLYLIILSFYAINEKITRYSPSTANKLISFLALFFLLSGLYLFIEHTTLKKQATDQRSLKNLSKLIDDVGNYAHFFNWTTIDISRDQIKDYLVAPISTLYYETHGVLFNMGSSLGGSGMNEETKENAISEVQRSDMYISALRNYTPDKIFPFERSIQNFRPLLRQVADKTMIRLGDYYLFHSMYRVYVRPDMRITGIEDNWITEQGIWVDIPAIIARKIYGTFVLEGDSDFSWLKKKPLKIQAITQQDGIDMPLQATISINNNHYKIICKLPKWNSNEVMSVHLTFSDYFIRKQKHHQIQKSVMQAPTKKYFKQ